MSESRSTDVVARYAAEDDRNRVKGAGALVCVMVTAIMGCAFWAAAVVASTPLIH